jgi:hypothetical protein
MKLNIKDMSESSSNSGIGFFGLLTILFIGLKLTNHIDWSWLWVLSPIWIPLSILIGIIIIVLVIWGLVKLISNK